MTTNRFRNLFDANLYEMYWLEETELTDKLADRRKAAQRRVKYLQAENRMLDAQYYYSLSLDEPIKYDKLQSYLHGKQRHGVSDTDN